MASSHAQPALGSAAWPSYVDLELVSACNKREWPKAKGSMIALS
jgi:hypothetical protein